MTLIAVSQVAVEFGATTIFEDITFTVAAGERWGIVGRNGTGKTTLFSLITGERRPTRGQVSRQPNTRVSLLEQHHEFAGATTSTLSRTKVNRISTSTWAVAPAATPKAVDSVSAKPSRTVRTR